MKPTLAVLFLLATTTLIAQTTTPSSNAPHVYDGNGTFIGNYTSYGPEPLLGNGQTLTVYIPSVKRIARFINFKGAVTLNPLEATYATSDCTGPIYIGPTLDSGVFGDFFYSSQIFTYYTMQIIKLVKTGGPSNVALLSYADLDSGVCSPTPSGNSTYGPYKPVVVTVPFSPVISLPISIK
jgi:hypothetical protein